MSRIGNLLKKTQMPVLKTNFKAILNSRILLYFILFLSIVDLYIFAVNGELLYVAMFIIIGFLTAFFSKNMMVILFVAMTLTNILRFGKDIRVKEGMEGPVINGVEEDHEREEMTNVKETKDVTNKGDDDEGGDDDYMGKDADEKKSSKKKTTKPATTSITEKEVVPAEEKDINNKLTSLDKDTANLLAKQKKLMENMQNLNPLLVKAEQFLEKFNNVPTLPN